MNETVPDVSTMTSMDVAQEEKHIETTWRVRETSVVRAGILMSARTALLSHIFVLSLLLSGK